MDFPLYHCRRASDRADQPSRNKIHRISCCKARSSSRSAAVPGIGISRGDLVLTAALLTASGAIPQPGGVSIQAERTQLPRDRSAVATVSGSSHFQRSGPESFLRTVLIADHAGPVWLPLPCTAHAARGWPVVSQMFE